MNEGKVAGENISRMGMLHFKNDKLPDTKALLRIHDGHIDVTIVWNPSDSTFERCFFSEHVFYADDPDRKKYVYDLPKIMTVSQFTEVYLPFLEDARKSVN